jgi:hypothetical protein
VSPRFKIWAAEEAIACYLMNGLHWPVIGNYVVSKSELGYKPSRSRVLVLRLILNPYRRMLRGVS